MAEVIIKGLSKVYEGERKKPVAVVEDVNLAIRDGEFFVLVGPSGCGKSTTLRMIAGLDEISAGTISIDGKRINDTPPKDREIAMVFQNYALYPHMTVYKNMSFGLELQKLPKDQITKRVENAANILGLTNEMLQRKPKALSGGQRQRVALGRAIVRDPKVFLFDEPLSNLDAKMRVQMRAEIAKLHARFGSTMVYVTHDQVEAMTLGDRICVMKDGRVQQVAAPLEIYNKPANMFVAGFIGSPPINFQEGTIDEIEGGFYFVQKGVENSDTGIKLRIPASREKLLAAWLSRPVIIGLRPEDIHECGFAAERDPLETFQARLQVIEAMGAETYLYLKSGAQTVIVRVPRQIEAKIGANVSLSTDMSKALFFKAADREPFRKDSGAIDTDRWHCACEAIA